MKLKKFLIGIKNENTTFISYMKGENEFFPSSQSQVMYLNEDLFPEVTFENSPVEVELKIEL